MTIRIAYSQLNRFSVYKAVFALFGRFSAAIFSIFTPPDRILRPAGGIFVAAASEK